ncbi:MULTISPECIES: hypothetical protein [Paenibacillus]|uniref:hypothetical protein n=1 Tax=Paenibacillus TaxID=44249 RepID=UPI00096F054A|nr:MULTISPECIES: hypothetical protein [Paenibacillus]OMF39764.1 hypothetical protein BK135_24995 [Paenibacillus peoriae]QYK62575.1 hypothetical protein KAI37_02905 [Paenibacillus sp. S25]
MTRVWREGDLDTTFRRAFRFIDGNESDMIGAFPVLNYKPDHIFDIIFVKESAGKTVSLTDLLHQHDFAMFSLHKHFERADFIYDNVKYVTGFPVHEFKGSSAGVTLLHTEAIEIQTVSKGITGLYGIPVNINGWGDLLGALNGVDKFALEKGFVGGFLDSYSQPDYHRLFLFKEGYFERKPIPEWRLNHLTNFQYFLSNSGQEEIVRKAHNVICKTIDSCNVLTEEDKLKLKNIYFEQIFYHYEGVIPGIEAQAKLHGNGMRFDSNFLTTATLYRLTGTVLHEMMHSLGYTHPHHTDPTYSSSIPERVRSCIPTSTVLVGESLEYQVRCEIL